MSDLYGDDFITITDEDGTDYEMEVLDTLEYNGATYLAVCDATLSEDAEEVEYSLLKVDVQDGEEFLITIDDEDELAAVDVLFDEHWQQLEDEAAEEPEEEE